MSRSSPRASTISYDQRRFTTSNSDVPEASETSRRVFAGKSETQVVLGQQHLADAFEIGGSLSRTHSSLGSVKPVSTGLAVYFETLSRPTVRLMASTCAWLR